MEWGSAAKADVSVPKQPKIRLSAAKPPTVKSPDPCDRKHASVKPPDPCPRKHVVENRSAPSVPKQTSKSICRKPVGIHNYGNTCYAGATLQALFALPELWKKIPSDYAPRVPLLKALVKTMLCLNTSKEAIDPKSFLSQLGSYVSKVKGTLFQVNTQHDACEVLEYILQELVASSNVISASLTTRLARTVTCYTCEDLSEFEDSFTILAAEMEDSVERAVNRFMKDDVLSYTCRSCNSMQEGARDTKFVSLPKILIIQVKRFACENNVVKKVSGKILCDQVLSLTVNPGTNNRKVDYRLTAVVNHSGSLHSGHYTATIIDRASRRIRVCNDSDVKDGRRIDYKTAYILFYIQVE